MAADKTSQETVVLIHGLWMRGWVMAWWAWRLRRAGFRVEVFSYPSLRASLTGNALRLARFVSHLDAPRIHFVGHSLGGLLIWQMLATHADRRTGRLVFVGSPFRGSYTASKLARRGLGRWLLGASVLQWLRQPAPQVDPRYELGVIAGCKPIGLGRLVGGLPAPSDGAVCVVETAAPGSRDQIVLKVSHSGMLISPQVTRQINAFLCDGNFLHVRS